MLCRLPTTGIMAGSWPLLAPRGTAAARGERQARKQWPKNPGRRYFSEELIGWFLFFLFWLSALCLWCGLNCVHSPFSLVSHREGQGAHSVFYSQRALGVPAPCRRSNMRAAGGPSLHFAEKNSIELAYFHCMEWPGPTPTG